jgi:hypothetical protein
MPLRLYLGSIPVTIGGFPTTTVITGSQWIRPVDWLAMPSTASDGFIGLLAVYTGSSNFVALSSTVWDPINSVTGSYWVDWGDGTSASYFSTQTAQYSHSYDALPSSSYSSGSDGMGNSGSMGYRQALVQVTPSGSGTLNSFTLQKKHSRPTLPSIPEVPWLDIALGGININLPSSSIGGTVVSLACLEHTSIATIGTGSNFTYMFQNCYSLASFSLGSSTISASSFSNMFNGCYSLQSASLFDTFNGTNFTSMFQNCYALQTVPSFNVSSGTNFTSMFQTCYSLQTAPSLIISPISGSIFTSMFQSCASLQTVPLLNLGEE